MPSTEQIVPVLYAYIDESGDEGFPRLSPHTDVLAYRNRAIGNNGPSAFFMMCAALVEDTNRAGHQAAIRALSKILHPTVNDKEIHWRDLSWEQKQFAAEECCKLDFMWYAVVAYKPALPNAYKPPYLYNWCTRLLLERLCIAASDASCELVPVFSNRSRTDYVELQKYVSKQVDAFGTSGCLKPIRTQQPNKERLLQLVDVCAGSLQNALEVNAYGKLQPAFFKATYERLARPKNTIWGRSLKFYPETVGTDFGPATAWIDAVRKK